MVVGSGLLVLCLPSLRLYLICFYQYKLFFLIRKICGLYLTGPGWAGTGHYKAPIFSWISEISLQCYHEISLWRKSYAIANTCFSRWEFTENSKIGLAVLFKELQTHIEILFYLHTINQSYTSACTQYLARVKIL